MRCSVKASSNFSFDNAAANSALKKFAFFVERRVHRIAVRGAVAVVAIPLVFQDDGYNERDDDHGDDEHRQTRHGILHQAAGNRAGGEEIDEIAGGLVVGLEDPPAGGHVVMVAEPGLRIVWNSRVVILAAVLASEPAAHDLQTSKRDRRQTE